MNLKINHIVLMENIIPLPQKFVEILLKKNTDMPVKLLRGTCSTCKRNKSPILSDQICTSRRVG